METCQLDGQFVWLTTCCETVALFYILWDIHKFTVVQFAVLGLNYRNLPPGSRYDKYWAIFNNLYSWQLSWDWGLLFKEMSLLLWFTTGPFVNRKAGTRAAFSGCSPTRLNIIVSDRRQHEWSRGTELYSLAYTTADDSSAVFMSSAIFVSYLE